MRRQKLNLLAVLMLVMLFTAGNAHAVDLWYDFEGDSGRTATDKLTTDGAQDGTFLNNVSIQTAPGNVPWGTQSSLFDIPGPTPPAVERINTLEIPSSSSLTETFTLAMHVNNIEDPLDFTRLFTSYGGTGDITADRVLFDYDPSGDVLPLGMRAIVNGVGVEPAVMPAGLSDPGYHHYAVTAAAGMVSVYFDGVEIASADVGTGYSLSGANIRIGEDPHDLGGGAIEQLYGNVDDVLVIDQALSAVQIASLAGGATVQSVVTPTGSYAVNYDFEGDSGTTITDKFTADGSQDGIVQKLVSIDTNPANSKQGNASAAFQPVAPEEPYSQIYTGVTGTDLGDAFTLSAVINVAGDGYSGGQITRLFTTYSGAGSADGRLIMDFEPDASNYDFGVRTILPDGTSVSTGQTFSYGENHTLTTVYDGSTVKIYIDGVEATSGAAAVGGVVDLGDYTLMIGEDLGGWVGEQFIGTMDDVLILGRALTDGEVLTLHQQGAAVAIGNYTPIPGDANHDGVVNEVDAGFLAANWLTLTGATWAMGDFNGDNAVNDLDATILASNWQTGTSTSASVPEPCVFTLLVLLLPIIMIVRRRS